MPEASRRVRIALVRQRYNPYGGAERFIERTLPALERAGHELTLIAREFDAAAPDRVLRVDPFFLGNAWRDWSFGRAARAAWQAAGFDLVQSHERIAGCDIYRAGDGVHAHWLEIRRSMRGCGPAGRVGIALNPYHRYVCAAERHMFTHPRLRAVICNSNFVREDIERRFRVAPQKLHLIYNGVDLEHFHPRERAARRAAARAELGLEDQETLFLFVGSGFARKGLDAAIDALALCSQPGYRLAVAGSDRAGARYAARAAAAGLAARVQLLGGRGELRPLYAAADCFILPTRYDPFPSSALEALAMGVPAIVGRRCGAAEIIEPGRSGWILESDDIAALADLMREAARAADDPATGSACRAAAERYGMDDMARKLSDLYAGLA